MVSAPLKTQTPPPSTEPPEVARLSLMATRSSVTSESCTYMPPLPPVSVMPEMRMEPALVTPSTRSVGTPSMTVARAPSGPSMFNVLVTGSIEPTAYAPAGTTTVSAPTSMFDSWIAARRVQAPLAAAHMPLPAVESLMSSVELTVNVAACAAGEILITNPRAPRRAQRRAMRPTYTGPGPAANARAPV
jgi:hypothetical protein